MLLLLRRRRRCGCLALDRRRRVARCRIGGHILRRRRTDAGLVGQLLLDVIAERIAAAKLLEQILGKRGGRILLRQQRLQLLVHVGLVLLLLAAGRGVCGGRCDLRVATETAVVGGLLLLLLLEGGSLHVGRLVRHAGVWLRVPGGRWVLTILGKARLGDGAGLRDARRRLLAVAVAGLLLLLLRGELLLLLRWPTLLLLLQLLLLGALHLLHSHLVLMLLHQPILLAQLLQRILLLRIQIGLMLLQSLEHLHLAGRQIEGWLGGSRWLAILLLLLGGSRSLLDGFESLVGRHDGAIAADLLLLLLLLRGIDRQRTTFSIRCAIDCEVMNDAGVGIDFSCFNWLYPHVSIKSGA